MQAVILSRVFTLSFGQEYSLGEWTVAGMLNVPTTQFYGAIDSDTSTAYITGGLVSDTQARNLVESIMFTIEDETLTVLSKLHDFVDAFDIVSVHHSTSEQVNNLFVTELGLQWSLSSWYGRQQSSGFYDNSIFIIEPIYEANPADHYFLKCDVLQQTCSFESTQHLIAEEPCISQQDQYLYIVGGFDAANMTSSQQINVSHALAQTNQIRFTFHSNSAHFA